MKNQIVEIRTILSTFTSNEIEECLNNQIQLNCNTCLKEADSVATINVLTKAHYINGLVEQGDTVNGAIRKLGRQIRQMSIQSESKAPLPYKALQKPLNLN